jgi:DNA polymerase-3 subunit delta
MTELVYFVKGTDPLLRDGAVAELVAELLGDDDRTVALEDFTMPAGPGDGDDDARTAAVAEVLNAASSPPFMSTRRVIVVREIGELKKEHVQMLDAFLEGPLETTVLVFVAGGKLDALAKRLKALGAHERAPATEDTGKVLTQALRGENLELRPDAAELISKHLGGDAGRVGSLVEVLNAAYGDGVTLTADDVAPYVGEAGSVPSYQLASAIEAGDAARALEVLHRLLHAPTPRDPGGMHPIQVLGLLASYYRRLLRLDDSSVRTSADAVAALGGRVKEFPARKALDAARALGTDGIRRAFDALYQADLDLKGARGIPPDAVVEILVVRLARLARAGARRR